MNFFVNNPNQSHNKIVSRAIVKMAHIVSLEQNKTGHIFQKNVKIYKQFLSVRGRTLHTL